MERGIVYDMLLYLRDNLHDKLDDIYKWSQAWQLSISYMKCNLMYIGNTLCIPSLLSNVTLTVKDEVRDLGVTIDSHLMLFYTHRNR